MGSGSWLALASPVFDSATAVERSNERSGLDMDVQDKRRMIAEFANQRQSVAVWPILLLNSRPPFISISAIQHTAWPTLKPTLGRVNLALGLYYLRSGLVKL
jgi:hypothetical protein